MTPNIPKVLWPTVVGITTYIIVNRLFPEKQAKGFEKNPIKGIRCGSRAQVVKQVAQQIAKKILKDRALKIALLGIFATAGVTHFQSEIEELLSDGAFKQICHQKVDGKLKLVCDMVKEHELDLHTKSIRSLIAANNISSEQKITLLKIKLDYIINGEFGGKWRFLIVALIAAIITLTVSGLGGLALILEALYRLFQEGKISKALYNQIVKALAKRWGVSNVPVEHFIE